MHRASVLLALCLATAVGGEAPSFRVVTLEGSKACFNYSRSILAWGTKAREGRPAGMVVREGDLLFLQQEALVPWRHDDGHELVIAYEGARVLLGGNVVALKLGNDKKKQAALWQWVEAADRETLAQLRGLVVEALDADRLPLLRKIAEANPALGLMIDDDVKEPVLPLFQPTWCLVDAAALADRDRAPDASLRHVRYLGIMNPKKPDHLDVVGRMPALRHLVIPEWDGEWPERLPDSCSRLRALTLGGDAPDLGAIAHLADLEELYIFDGDKLTDIGVLAGLGQLRALSLSHCENLTDLTALEALSELRWLGLPPKVTQDQLAGIVAAHPKLEFLSLVDCKGIRDLRLLAKLPALHGLALVKSEARLEPLAQMQGLRFLALDGEYFEKAPVAVQLVEEALPEAAVVEGGGICLGSGWALLLLPALAAAWLVGRLRKRRLAAHG